MLTIENSFFLSLAILTLGIFITSLESLVKINVYKSTGIFNWDVSSLTMRWVFKGFFSKFLNIFFDESRFGYFLFLQCISSFVLFILSCLKILIPFLVVFEFILLLLFFLRTPYVLDGSHHINVVVLGSLALSSLFGIESKISLICMCFVASQLILSYFIAGFRKIQSPFWRSGEAICLIFRTNAFGNNFVFNLTEKNRLIKLLLSWSVITFEISFPLILIFDIKIALVFFVVAFIFHIMTAIFMGFNHFLPAFISAYPLAIFCHQWSEIKILFITTLFYAVVPLFFLAYLWNHKLSSYKIWYFRAIFIAIYIINLSLIEPLPLSGLGYFSQYLFLILFLISIIPSFKLVAKNKLLEKTENSSLPKYAFLKKLGNILSITIILFMSWEITCAIRGKQLSEAGIELEFPLKHGTFYILQGGNHHLINHHYQIEGQKFALDILKLNVLGFRSNNFIPTRLEDYSIYGAEVYSPISGYVTKVNDGLKDLLPAHVDISHPAGNYIVIKKENSDVCVLLAHLQCNTILGQEGSYVKAGQLIGKVGNSGNTTEPHLHIHSMKMNDQEDFLFSAKSVPMIFNNKFLTRNSIFY